MSFQFHKTPSKNQNMKPNYYKRSLTGLIIKCPMRNAVCNCSLKDLREQKANELTRYLNSMSDAEAKGWVNKHDQCFAKRQVAVFSAPELITQ